MDALRSGRYAGIPLRRLQQLGRHRSGVAFATYSLLARAARLGEALAWLGGGSGVLCFDEAHRAKNYDADPANSSRTGSAVVRLQAECPNARVLYSSATAASTMRDLGYMPRVLQTTGLSHAGLCDLVTAQGSWGEPPGASCVVGTE